MSSVPKKLSAPEVCHRSLLVLAAAQVPCSVPGRSCRCLCFLPLLNSDSRPLEKAWPELSLPKEFEEVNVRKIDSSQLLQSIFVADKELFCVGSRCLLVRFPGSSTA